MRRGGPLSLILFATCMVGFTSLTLVDVRYVHGESMAPELGPGQIVVVNRWNYGLQLPFLDSYLVHWNHIGRGDIVVYRSPETGSEVVKRCYGIPGDTISAADGVVVVAGRSFPISLRAQELFSRLKTIPNGFLFLVGDNAARSQDSRDYGLISRDAILGRVIQIIGSGSE